MKVDRVSPTQIIVEVDNEAETARLGRALASLSKADLVVGLVGPLGAGKTNLVRAWAEGLGVDPVAIASPTFVLIHEYEGRVPVYHFDTYRLGGPDEFDGLGAADYFQAGGVCLIEWADRVRDRLPANAWWIELIPDGDQRTIVLEIGDAPTSDALMSWFDGLEAAN